MKRSIISICLSLAVAATALTSCENGYDSLSPDSSLSNADGNVPEGYFRAAFFPQAATDPATRAAVEGESTQIQSLVCLIYRKQADGTYMFYPVEEQDGVRTILSPTQPVQADGSINPDTHTWPLDYEETKASLTFDLPVGDYRAVFVANVDPNLFSGQKDTDGNDIPLLTDYTQDFASARINMPEAGPTAFNDYNMYYLCAVDFSPSNPSPYVLLQRLVADNVYTRAAIDTNEAVDMLVDNIVAEVRKEQLTTDILRGVLKSKIGDALHLITDPDALLLGLTDKLVDPLVNALLGDVLEALNETLLKEVKDRLENTLKGNLGSEGEDLLGLSYILNPWTAVNEVTVNYDQIPKSIDFSRQCKSYYQGAQNGWTLPIKSGDILNGGLSDYENMKMVSAKTLCGDHRLASIDVDMEKFILASALQKVDEQVLNGLLINIHHPLAYGMHSNLRYESIYKLINLTLSDFSADSSDKPLSLGINLNEVVNLEQVVSQIIGDNIVSGLIGGLTDKLLQPILDALDDVIVGLNIRLPGLNLNNIKVDGSWDVTRVSDGTITPVLPPLN